LFGCPRRYFLLWISRVGVGLILIAVGAILAWAVDVNTSGLGFDVNTIGYILLVVGIIGCLLSLVFWSSWAGPGSFGRRRVVDEGPSA
jgi:hypothetical protein